MRLVLNAAALVCLISLPVLLTACLDDKDFDHKPPSGQGSIVVDNRTSNDVNVFINGTEVQRVRARRWRAYDLDPGVYRVVVDERHGDRNFRGDVDVLSGRLTIMETTIDPQRIDRYSMFIYFD